MEQLGARDHARDYQQNASFLSYNYLHAPSYSANCDLTRITSCATFEFASKLVSTTASGSYISGATRAFDGVVIDIEPTGRVRGDDSYFNYVKQLMIEIQSAFRADPALADRQTAFTAPKFGTGDLWDWNASYYHYMARHVDYIIAMTYDSRQTTGNGYANWIAHQTKNILDSVSGLWWNFDADHPAPTNGVKVFIGFPAFPERTPIHCAFQRRRVRPNPGKGVVSEMYV